MSHDEPIRGFVPLVVGTDAGPGRMFAVNASVAGNVTVKMRDGSTQIIAVGVGYFDFPYSVRQVTASTATATYANGI